METHYNESALEKAREKRAADAVYDIVYEVHRSLDKLMDEWGSMYQQERREAIEQTMSELKAALEVL